MQKTKKGKLTLIISVIALLGLILVALTAVGITYTRYVSSSSSPSSSVLIPEWSFDLSSGDTDFNTKTSAKLHPDESVYDADTNNDRESLSIPIPVALLVNNGDVNGDVYLNAYLDNDQPYIVNERYIDNETYEAEFSSHFIFNLYYSASEIEISDDEDYDYSALLTEIDKANPLTLYSPNIADNSTTLSSVYLYTRVIWKSDINGNGDSFDSWVGRGIDKINIDIDCDIYQNGEGSIAKPTLTTGKLGVAYTATTWLYFDGSITSNHLGVTEDYDSAADVTVYEYPNGHINLAYTDESGATLYLASSENSSNTSYMSSSTVPYDWYFNDAYYTSFNSNEYFIGQYNTNQYLACYLTSNISSSNYRVAEIYTSEPTPEGVPSVGDQTYKLGVLDSDTYKYFSGTVGNTSNNHLDVTTSYDDAVDIYITPVSSSEYDNACTLSFYSEGSLEYIACSENSTNMRLSTSSYTWVKDQTDGYFYTPSFNDRYIGLQAGNYYFGAYAASNSYLHAIAYSEDPGEYIPDTGGGEQEDGVIGSFDFSSHSGSSTSMTSSTDLSSYWSGDQSLYKGIYDVDTVYLGNSSGGVFETTSDCIRFSTGSSNGSLSLRFALGIKVSQVVVSAHSWLTTETDYLSVNGSESKACSTSGSYEDITYSFGGDYEYLLTLQATGRVFVQKITIYGEYDLSGVKDITSLTLTPEKFTLSEGEETNISISYTPEDTIFDPADLEWKSSDTSVATIAPTLSGATVTAHKSGEATISATASNGVTGSTTITVGGLSSGDETHDQITYQTIMSNSAFDGWTWSSSSQTVISSTSGTYTAFDHCSITWYTGSESSDSSNGCSIYASGSLRVYRGAYYEIAPLDGYQITGVTLYLSSSDSNLLITNASSSHSSGTYTLSGPTDSTLPITVKNNASSSNTETYAAEGIIVYLVKL